jgi:hypothetical protein
MRMNIVEANLLSDGVRDVLLLLRLLLSLVDPVIRRAVFFYVCSLLPT